MATLKQQALSGVRWTTINMVSITVLQFVQLAILARILGPNVYGLIAIVMVIIGFARVFSETGLSSAVIQRKNINIRKLSTLYWINVLVGLILYGIIYLCTPIISKCFKTQEINSLLPVGALSLVISAFGVQFQTLLRKILRFDIISKINVSSMFIGTIVAVSCGWSGYGVWSLIWGDLSYTSFSTGLFIIYGIKQKWWPKFYFKWSETKGYLSFGLYRIGSTVINSFNSKVDQLLIGNLMGMESLGYYNIAVRLVLQPIQKLNPILTNVAFPVFSKVQDDINRLKKGFFKMNKFLMTVNAPILIGLAVTAPLVVPLLIGKKWVPVVPLVQILAFYALIRSIGNASSSLIIAKGKANWSFYWNAAMFIVVPIVVYFSSLGGEMIYIAVALVCLHIILFFVSYWLRIRKLIGECLSEYIQALSIPILLSIIMGAIITIFSFFIKPLSSSIIQLFIICSIGLFIYILLSWFFQRVLFIELIDLLPERFGFSKFKYFFQDKYLNTKE